MENQPNYPAPDVLIAIMNNKPDLDIARKQRWYRIPVKNADRLVPELHEMRYLAFYQTRAFREEGYAVNYYAAIERIITSRRIELLPDQVGNQNANALYYKVEISPLQPLPWPITSKRPRRTPFIKTTLQKFRNAREIDDLFHDSPLEDLMWKVLRAAGIEAERQYEIREPKADYNLDFAVACRDGHWIDIECDGDAYHSTKTARDRDRSRNTYLTANGWSVLRFGTAEIRNHPHGCIDKIQKLVDQHGGLITRSIGIKSPMAENTPDLWPDDITVINFRAPVAILRRQAVLLGEKTENLVKGEVISKTHEGAFWHGFYVVAPALDNYRFQLFSVIHRINLYPLEIALSAGEPPIKVRSEREFIQALQEVFSGKETRRAIQTLIAQTQA